MFGKGKDLVNGISLQIIQPKLSFSWLTLSIRRPFLTNHHLWNPCFANSKLLNVATTKVKWVVHSSYAIVLTFVFFAAQNIFQSMLSIWTADIVQCLSSTWISTSNSTLTRTIALSVLIWRTCQSSNEELCCINIHNLLPLKLWWVLSRWS